MLGRCARCGLSSTTVLVIVAMLVASQKVPWPFVLPFCCLTYYKSDRGRATARPTGRRRATKAAQGRPTYYGATASSDGEVDRASDATVRATTESAERANDAADPSNGVVDRPSDAAHLLRSDEVEGLCGTTELATRVSERRRDRPSERTTRRIRAMRRA